MEVKNNMDNNKIEVTGISEPLLRLIDERVRHFGGDRAAYIRDLIYSAHHTDRNNKVPSWVQSVLLTHNNGQPT
jgi:hypothetical protein